MTDGQLKGLATWGKQMFYQALQGTEWQHVTFKSRGRIRIKGREPFPRWNGLLKY